jgi:hypothetical protein
MATETITQVTKPPAFIESEAKLYLEQLRKAIGGLKGVDLSKIMGPDFVAGLGGLTEEAIGMAGGLGSYEPYLQTAGGYSGPNAYKHLCLHINKRLLELHYQNMIFKHKKVHKVFQLLQ